MNNKDMTIYRIEFPDGRSGVFRRLTSLCKTFSKDEIGIGLQALYNAFSHSEEKVFENKKCIIWRTMIGEIR